MHHETKFPVRRISPNTFIYTGYSISGDRPSFSVLADIYLNHCQQIDSDFKEVVADCFDHIAKLKRDMAGRYYSEPEASA